MTKNVQTSSNAAYWETNSSEVPQELNEPLFRIGREVERTAEPPLSVRLPSGGMVYGFQGTSTMPNDNPGKLSRDQYADIVAYLLQLNGMPAGPRPLRPDPRQLEQIRIAIWSNR
jgi:hypothetical protein